MPCSRRSVKHVLSESSNPGPSQCVLWVYRDLRGYVGGERRYPLDGGNHSYWCGRLRGLAPDAGPTVDHCDRGRRRNSWRQYRLLARPHTWTQSVAQVGTLDRFGPAETRSGRVSFPPTWRQDRLSRTLRRGTPRICCRARRRRSFPTVAVLAFQRTVRDRMGSCIRDWWIFAGPKLSSRCGTVRMVDARSGSHRSVVDLALLQTSRGATAHGCGTRTGLTTTRAAGRERQATSHHGGRLSASTCGLEIASQCPLRVKLRNTQHEQMTSALPQERTLVYPSPSLRHGDSGAPVFIAARIPASDWSGVTNSQRRNFKAA